MPGGKHHHRRAVADCVEEAVGSQIDVAVVVDAADPANGPGNNQTIKGVLRQAVTVFRLVKH